MRQESGAHVCVSCQTNRAVSMCQECGAVVCPECIKSKTTEYFLCGECHTSIRPTQRGQKPETCPECGSEDVRAGKRLEDMCPRCHSPRVIAIEEKRQKLSQDLKHAMMSMQYGHLRLREFSTKLMSGKRLLCSLRMANFLAFKWLEEKLEKLQEEAPAIKNRVVSQADIIARRMAAETNGLMDHEAWSVDQFPYVEGLATRMAELGKQYRSSVDEALEAPSREMEDVSKQLEGLNYYRKEFAGFYEHAELSVNELPVCALPNIRVTGSDFLKTDKATGSLYVTNKRLVFVAETGTLRKKTGVVFDYPLIYLNAIEEDGRIRRRLVFKMKQGELKISCSEQTENVLIDYIEIARKFDRYVQTDMQRVRKLEQTDVSANDARLRIEELIHSLLSSTKRGKTGYQAVPLDTRSYPGDRGASSLMPPSLRSYYPEDPFSAELKDDLRRDMNRRVNTRDTQYGGEELEVRRLQQEAHGIDQAIRDSVEELRNGRLMTEEFVRRYRSLARDHYDTMRRIEYLTQRLQDGRW